MFKLFKRKNSQYDLNGELAVSSEDMKNSPDKKTCNGKSCQNCNNLEIGGGIILSCECKAGVFKYEKHPPKVIPEGCESWAHKSKENRKETKLPDPNGIKDLAI